MRRFLPTLTAGAVLLSSALPASAGGSAALRDLEGHWARTQIEAGLAAGYVSGFPDATFRPNQPVTRAEFFKLLSSAMRTTPLPGGVTDFREVQHWAFTQGHIQAAVTAGLLNPPDYGPELGPDSLIRRREIVIAAVRALGKAALAAEQPPELNTPDAGTYPDWLKSWAALAVGDGIMTGYEDGSLGLERTATRAEALVMIQRILGKATVGLEAAQPPKGWRYPAPGEPEWFLPTPDKVSNGTETYRLPDGARNLLPFPAPGNAAWVQYTIGEPGVNVIARLHRGTITETFRAELASVVAVDARGRAWLADPYLMKIANADGTVTALEAGAISVGAFDAQGNLWGVPATTQKQLYRFRPEGQVEVFETGLPLWKEIWHLAIAPDGAVWLVLSDMQTRETEAWQFVDGRPGRRLKLLSRQMLSADPGPFAIPASSGESVWVDRAGEGGLYRFDLATGAFRPVVLPRSVQGRYEVVASPDARAVLLKDASGQFWKVMP